jgi:hypothetical protein
MIYPLSEVDSTFKVWTILVSLPWAWSLMEKEMAYMYGIDKDSHQQKIFDTCYCCLFYSGSE